jgi:hypothetical protein
MAVAGVKVDMGQWETWSLHMVLWVDCTWHLGCTWRVDCIDFVQRRVSNEASLYIPCLCFMFAYFVLNLLSILGHPQPHFHRDVMKCMNESRVLVRPIATHFMWMWYVPAFVNFYFFHYDEPCR